jgi:hypothetical protein
VAQREHQTAGGGDSSLEGKLRSPELPLQLFGYSREHTDRLFAKAAREFKETVSRLESRVSELETALATAEQRLAKAAEVERTVGAAMITAHGAVEAFRSEAARQADELLSGARAQANTILDEAKQSANDIEAERALAEAALARARDEAQTVHEVIATFGYQWWKLMTDALKQLGLRAPRADGGAAEADQTLLDELRGRLGEAQSVDRSSDQN